MSDSIRTLSMQQLVAQFQMGDSQGFNELIRRTQESLERCAVAMFQKFPSLFGKEEVEDVLQNALRKLESALRVVMPNSIRHYYALANEQIRRSLLDLTRYYRRRPQLQQAPEMDSQLQHDPLEVPATSREEDRQLEMWENFHEAISTLPELEREVFSLTFYHKWTQAEIADLLGFSGNRGTRQVRQILKKAYDILKQSVGTDCLNDC